MEAVYEKNEKKLDRRADIVREEVLYRKREV